MGIGVRGWRMGCGGRMWSADGDRCGWSRNGEGGCGGDVGGREGGWGAHAAPPLPARAGVRGESIIDIPPRRRVYGREDGERASGELKRRSHLPHERFLDHLLELCGICHQHRLALLESEAHLPLNGSESKWDQSKVRHQ